VTDNANANPTACDGAKQLTHDRRAQKAQLLKIAREIKANLPDDMTSDHSWLYDHEAGLPR
jgi:hypothetical protein